MRILVGEDDDIARENLVTILEKEGFHVDAAPDGTATLARWQAAPADFIILDIMMPGLSGFDVCREIRKSNPSVPILFLSAKSEEVDVVVGLELGADDFLRKPCGEHELVARIRAVLRRQHTDESVTFPVGPWKIHSTHLLANDGDHSIDLTPREVRILRYLQQNPGRDISRDDLLHTCWGLEFFPGSRTLDQHISNLRKKIGDRWILTVRGIGYKYPG